MSNYIVNVQGKDGGPCKNIKVTAPNQKEAEDEAIAIANDGSKVKHKVKSCRPLP